MEGLHHKKRAVRIARKGVAPSPHVIHLGRREAPVQEPVVEQVIATPRSLVFEVAIDTLRSSMHRRVRSALTDSTARLHKAASDLRSRVAARLASRVTTTTVHMPPRTLSIAFFVALLALLVLPFGAARLYHDFKIREGELRERKMVMVALSDQVRAAVSAGDFDTALQSLQVLKESIQETTRAIDGFGILRYVPQLYQTRAGLTSAVVAIGQGSVAMEGLQRFPLSREVFASLHTTLTALDSAAAHLGRARLGFDSQIVRGYTRLFDDGVTVAESFLGGQEGRYLVVFQNENEIRPTGGFMGSFAVLTLQNGGYSIEMPSQGSYALQGWLTKSVRAPKPLSLINSRFEFQDVNWFPDFPTTAQKIMSFYEAGGGGSVDGVVAVNSSFLNDVMKLAGPIQVAEVGSAALKSGTVVESLEKAIARDRASAAPKAVLGGLLNALAAKFEAGEIKPLALSRAALSGLVEKKIQIYFRDNQKQSAVTRLGFSGSIPRDWDKDFFMVVSANVAGGKTDGAIRDVADYNVSVTEAGEMVARVTLTRTHEGLRGDALRGVRNVSYVRFYAPEGSQFLGATGFSKAPVWRFEKPDATLLPDEDVRAVELTEKTDSKSGTMIAMDDGKSVFGNWLMVDPGEVKTVQLTYVLPYRIAQGAPSDYALMAVKQSGRDATLHFTMNAPGFSIHAAGQGASREGFSLSTTLTADAVTRLRLVP